jgi:hypothetical protein
MTESTTAPKHYLASRENWQMEAVTGGAKTRDDVADVIRAYLDTAYPGEFEVTKEPMDLAQIYYWHDYARNPELYREGAEGADVWWDPARGAFMTRKAAGAKPTFAMGGGCKPDVKILCKGTGRIYFIECKHQNDAGNAHERAAKYATPSIIGLIKERIGGVSYHPVGYLFSGSMVEKRKYRLELQATFAFAEDHLFLWGTAREPAALSAWLKRAVVPILRGAA